MRYALMLSLSASLFAAPLLANEPEDPVTQKDLSAADVAATPATDLNLKRDEIPALLADAEQDAYGLDGLGSCRRLATAISDLDQVLGDDFDLPQVNGKRIRPGHTAQQVVGSFIPFRGVIREISGANAQERKLQSAIAAGSARRSFLKGTGQARGCAYPARSAR